jgi:ribosomal RNA-processing protein 8
VYHSGFREQAATWSDNPLNEIIKYLQSQHSSKNKLVLDLGCGEAELQQRMKGRARVRSFDLVARKPWVEVADVRSLPVKDGEADVCVFCLSLMGTNYI